MPKLNDLFQTADWKSEKHVPVIEAPEQVKKGELVEIKVTVGKEIPHPNTTEHHIRWVEIYFQADGEKFPWQLARVEFASHGESTKGPNTSTVYAQPNATVIFKTDLPGTILASSYCNIHGLWTNAKILEVK